MEFKPGDNIMIVHEETVGMPSITDIGVVTWVTSDGLINVTSRPGSAYTFKYFTGRGWLAVDWEGKYYLPKISLKEETWPDSAAALADARRLNRELLGAYYEIQD